MLRPAPAVCWRPKTPVSRRALRHCIASTWPGLADYRTLPVDGGRYWGEQGPCEPSTPPVQLLPLEQPTSLAAWGALVLRTADPIAKATHTHTAWQLWNTGTLPLGHADAPNRPARPAAPALVPPKQVPSQRDSGLEPAAFMYDGLHCICTSNTFDTQAAQLGTH